MVILMLQAKSSFKNPLSIIISIKLTKYSNQGVNISPTPVFERKQIDDKYSDFSYAAHFSSSGMLQHFKIGEQFWVGGSGANNAKFWVEGIQFLH